MALPEILEAGAGPSEPAVAHEPAMAESGAIGERRQRFRARGAWLVVGLTLASLLVLCVGFTVYAYGLSSVSEAREQSVLSKTFAGELSQATAPVGPIPDDPTGTNPNAGTHPIPDGSPVALLNIPALGISGLVVVEGSAAGDTMRGPGHVRSSALPGQAGVSVVYGRVATFGAPFAHLMRLNRGDRIIATTGQGVSMYRVASFGTSARPAPDPTPNRLVLETADSSPFSKGAVMVTADLVGAPQPNPGGWPAISPQERFLAGDPGALIPLTLWSQVLLLLTVGGVVLAYRWNPWAVLVCATPAVLAVAWAVYENTAALLPNIY